MKTLSRSGGTTGLLELSRPFITDDMEVSLPDQQPDLSLRNAPLQARSRARLGRVLDAAEQVLERDGAEGFSTTAVARMAGVSVGSVYRFFPDKQALAEALAVRYWSDFADLVAGVAEADALEPVADPATAVLGVLAAGFRARPGFLALWYGELRTERVRDRTRDARQAIATSIEQILAVHWPAAPEDARAVTAQMVVLSGDGLLREAFRRDLDGDAALLAESGVVLSAYIAHRLGTALSYTDEVR
jgi:AcrR family transcriptional regulator